MKAETNLINVTSAEDIVMDKSNKKQTTVQPKPEDVSDDSLGVISENDIITNSPMDMTIEKDITVGILNNTQPKASIYIKNTVNYKLPLIISLIIVLSISLIIALSLFFNSKREHDPIPQVDVEMQTFQSSSNGN